MVQTIFRKNGSPNHHDEPPIPPPPIVFILSIIGLIIFVLAAMALPSSNNQGPPEEVMTYRDGNLICWDKIVCCDPSDNSTCAAIPICEIDHNY